MIIKMQHPFRDEVNEMDLDVTKEDLHKWKNTRGLAQHHFPHLTDDEREFLITGLLPGEFEKVLNGENITITKNK